MSSDRRFSRVPFRIEAEIQSDNGTFYGDVRNLSLKGMFVAVPESHPVGEVVDIKIFLAHDDPVVMIEVVGEVVRTDSEGIAVKFTRVDLDSFTHLRKVVSLNTGDDDAVMDELLHYGNGDPGA
jgi:hypothetical protein